MKCNVVCIQTYPKMNQKEENISHMETLLRKAMESHPDTQLIVFPELLLLLVINVVKILKIWLKLP